MGITRPALTAAATPEHGYGRDSVGVTKSSDCAQAQPAVDHPVELQGPDVSHWRLGNTGTAFVHTFDSDHVGPELQTTSVVHGNEIAGAAALQRLLSEELAPSRGGSRSPMQTQPPTSGLIPVPPGKPRATYA